MAYPSIRKALNPERKYRMLRSHATEEQDIESKGLVDDGSYSERRVAPKPTAWIHFTLANLIILCITLSSLLFSSRGQSSCLENASYWSPVLDGIHLPLHDVKMNGTLFAKPEVSIAREEPGPENDAKWAEFEKVLTHVVTREEIVKLGKDPDRVARFEDDYWGFGDNAYMVQMDIMHQIHCLNLLRKAAFADYPGYSPEMDPHDKMWWIHLGHCVDILLQNIQCSGNTEVLTLAWVQDRVPPWPDFSIHRKCRDFNALVKWQHEHAVDPDKYDAMPVPENAFVWPAPWQGQVSELGEMLGQEHQQEGKKRRPSRETDSRKDGKNLA